MAKPPKVPAHLRRIENQLSRTRREALGAELIGGEQRPVRVERQGMSRRTKVLIGVGGGAAVGGGLVAIRRHQRSKDEVDKAAYSQDGTRVVRLTARTPTGRFVSHENDLHVVHITPKRHPTSRLAVYHGGRGANRVHVDKAAPKPTVANQLLRRKLTSAEPTTDFAARIQQAKAKRVTRGTGVGKRWSD